MPTQSGAETPCQKWGGLVFMKFTIYIHSEILHSSFDPLTTKFWGAQPPLPKSGRAQAPPSPPPPPRFSASDNVYITVLISLSLSHFLPLSLPLPIPIPLLPPLSLPLSLSHCSLKRQKIVGFTCIYRLQARRKQISIG